MASYNSGWVTLGRRESGPEDAEKEDKAEIEALAEALMEEKYPPFAPEIVHTLGKDYYLPALKVLEMNKDSKFFSPSETAEWVDNELVAECRDRSGWPIQVVLRYMRTDAPPVDRHKAPDESCECGIYGSVNMEEVRAYLEKDDPRHTYSINLYAGPQQILEEKKKVLCIIEPAEGAEVIVCRKGWRASKAFISEIVGETISTAEASQLLSVAWQRNVDVRRVFHEDR